MPSLSMNNLHPQQIMLHKLSLICIIIIMLSACGTTPIVLFADVCNQQNATKLISTEGYFVAGSSVFCSNITGSMQCGLEFVAEPSQTQGFHVQLQRGNQPNQIEVPDNFTEATIILHANDGSRLMLDRKAHIAGIMTINQAENVCVMHVERVEQTNQ